MRADDIEGDPALPNAACQICGSHGFGRFLEIHQQATRLETTTLSGMTALALQNALVTNEQLAESPSKRDGVPEETEKIVLSFGCELIQSAGIMLKL
jgi:hypothetical protein